jgi:hypothetical protein
MAIVKVSRAAFLALLAAVVIGFLPCAAPAGGINALQQYFSPQTATGEVTVGGQLYKVTSTTIPLEYFTYCDFLATAMTKQFPNVNFAFAGEGVADNIANIAASDFTVCQYMPWVVNNNANANFVTGPDGMNYNRKRSNLDGGGADILISYAPQNNGTDPTSVNFLQGAKLSITGVAVTKTFGGPLNLILVDNGGQATPFYNPKGVSGVGTTRVKASPLTTSPAIPPPPGQQGPPTPAVPAWMIDIPLSDAREAGGAFTAVVTFQTFIESSQMIDVNGKSTNYDVLYGGVQWGYTVTLNAVPEPSSLTLLFEAATVAALGCSWRRRSAKRTVVN